MAQPATPRADARAVLEAAMRTAGQTIEALKAAGLAPRDKADASPVTEADEAAEQILEAAVRGVEPDAVIVGEETASAGHLPPPPGRFWLIDPLDGTRDFIAGRDGYTVNLALVVAGVPVFGLVLHPPSGRLWGGAVGEGAWQADREGGQRAIRTRTLPAAPALVLSHSHLDAKTRAWAEAVEGATRASAGSSIKFCLLAEGTADAYPRFGPTMEWDTAAADAVLRAAGGITIGADGAPLRYGKPGYRNEAFLAIGDPGATGKLPAFA
ncbi:3'(2'),5'-bisphosphate nucleotidase CysQ family protein [Thermaurantiacus sp.]